MGTNPQMSTLDKLIIAGILPENNRELARTVGKMEELMEQRNENKTELKMIKMSDVQSQTVDWLCIHLSLMGN